MTPGTIIQPPKEIAVKKIKAAKKENLKQRAYLNSLSGIIDYAGAQITGFIINPFIVSGLGSVMYGVWQILTQLTGYTKLVDTRASQVLKWSLANKREIAKEEEFRSDITSALYVTAITLPLGLIAGSIISWYAPYISGADLKYYSLIRITCSILIFGLIANKFFDLFEATLGGMNLGYKRMGFRAMIVAIGGVLKVYVISKGYGLIGLSVVQVLNALVIGSTFYFIVKKNVPWFSLGTTTKSKVRSFGKLSGWFMGFSILKMILLSSDKVMLGYLAGPALVSNYALTMFTSTAIQGAMIAVIMGMTPGICTVFGKGEYERVDKARKTINSLTWLFCASVGSAVLLFNRSFIQLWVGNKHYAGNFENFLILVIAIQVIFFQLDSSILNASMDMKRKVKLSAWAAAFSIALSFILIQRFQIIGLCISTICGRLFYSIGFPVLLKRRMEMKVNFFNFKDMRMFITGISLFALTTVLGAYLVINNWFMLIISGVLSVMLAGFIFWVTGMNETDRKEALQAVSTIKWFKMN